MLWKVNIFYVRYNYIVKSEYKFFLTRKKALLFINEMNNEIEWQSDSYYIRVNKPEKISIFDLLAMDSFR